MPLTDTAIRQAKPGEKPFKLSDNGGLFLLIQPSGSKWWRYKYRFAGKEKALALGAYPEVTLAEARERHFLARKMLSSGRDPSEAKRVNKRVQSDKAANSFEIIAREWHEQHKSEWTNHYATEVLTRLERHVLPKLGPRPIADISAADVLEVLRVVEKSGALDMAQRMMQTCGNVFRYAIATQRAERNPVSDLRGALKTPERKNRSYLKADELPDYLQKLNAYDGGPITKLALRFLLLTFVRTTELRGAKPAEMNLDKAEWIIPAERMKMRDSHFVPLSTKAVAVLQELKSLTGQSEFVFPSQQKPSGCMSENTMLFALYRMGYHSKATGHGFRSTASTILNEHGFSPDVIERQLAHTERNKVRAAYNHAQYLPERRRMMQWWADHLDQLAQSGAAHSS